MPYTPPSVQSPVTSRPETPTLSRSQFYTKAQQQDKSAPSHGSRTELPHSSSRAYLNKHRRSPSISKSPSFDTGLSTPDETPQEARSSDSDDENGARAGRARQSSTKRPVAPEISSPISPPTSSDDETTAKRGRVRAVANLAELQAAIRVIEQHRAGSPDRQSSEEMKKVRMALGLPGPRLNISNKNSTSQPELSSGLPLSASAHKISHSRSTTDVSALFDFPRNKFDSPSRSTSCSDEDDVESDEPEKKPDLVRKKSGELVRPALRASSTRRRPSSMPGTPTYSKMVHFQDNSLEHVRHFLQVDRPIAVSAGSSPVESSYEDDAEFPFGNDNFSSRELPFEWEIRLTNFPRDSFERKGLPVRTEKVYLSTDKKVLIGSVIVRNLSFHKQVVARFTLDFWKTTSEVVAEYNDDVRQQQLEDGCDRFTFSIKLEDQANLENKTMFFCIRYNVNGQEYWDNNSSINYQVDFTKKLKPQIGKSGMQAKSNRPLNGLPRSKPSSTFQPRPRSMSSFDDFGSLVSPYEFSSFPQPSAMIGEAPIRFKNKPSTKDIVPDAPGRPKSSANQQIFGNRYNLNAHLSAAGKAASVTSVDRSELPLKCSARNASGDQSSSQKKDAGPPPVINVQPSPDAPGATEGSEASEPIVSDVPRPAALTTEKPSLQSSSYVELLNKYCFVRPGPNKDTQIVR